MQLETLNVISQLNSAIILNWEKVHLMNSSSWKMSYGLNEKKIYYRNFWLRQTKFGVKLKDSRTTHVRQQQEPSLSQMNDKLHWLRGKIYS